MPLPSRRKGEPENKFVSRCVSELARKGEGKDSAQRVAICKSRAAMSLTDDELEIVGVFAKEAMGLPAPQKGKPVTNLSPKKKKKKKDKDRITKEDGSGTDTDPSYAAIVEAFDKMLDCPDCFLLDEDEMPDSYYGTVEVYSTIAKELPKGRKLGKPFRTPGGPKKFSVYVKNDKGNVVKVNFGDPNMEIKRDDPERRKSFRARHNCDNPGPRWKARYWSCKMWSKKSVTDMT